MKKIFQLSAIAFFAAAPSLKATLIIGPGDFTTDGVGFNNLTSVTAGATTFTDLTFASATSAGNVDTDYWHSTLSQEVASGLAVEALTDQSPYTGALNPGRATTFEFGAAVPTDATFFVFGRGNNWPSSAIAVDFAGADLDLTVPLQNPGGTFALAVSGSPWARNPGTNFDSNLAGWSFGVNEFTGTGSLASVAGIRLNGNDDNFDPTLVGYGSAIPEPGSAALALFMGSLLLLRRLR